MRRSVQEKLRTILPAIVLGLTVSYMFFVVEPATLYVGNSDDVWFDMFDMLPEMLKMFGVCFGGILVAVGIVYGVSRRLGADTIFSILVACGFCGFLALYIQGNFLIGSLPAINGDAFNWRADRLSAVVSCLVWGGTLVGGTVWIIWAVKNKQIAMLGRATLWGSGAIFLMLSTSLVSVLASGALEAKESSRATYANFEKASTDENLLIFLVDAVDSRSFNESLLADEKYRDRYEQLFKDFLYFPDAMSYYAYTRDSIPMILTGEVNHNETSFGEYSRRVFNDSELFKKLKDEGFMLNYYDDEVILDNEAAARFSNMSFDVKILAQNFHKQILRYDAFKYLPWILKGKAHIEALSFSIAALEEGQEGFAWWNSYNHIKLTNQKIISISQKVFQFVHTEGAHLPLTMNEDFTEVPDLDYNRTTDYTKKEKATFRLIEEYIERLKGAGVYDNSTIVVLSDHGFAPVDAPEKEHIKERYNPILYIKAAEETHGQMRVSNKAVSYLDMEEALMDLAAGKKSSELFEDVGEERVRQVIYYIWSKEDHMVELETTGKAWETEKLTPTGREFNR